MNERAAQGVAGDFAGALRMEVVTVAYVVLHRPGSASSGRWPTRKPIHLLREADDEQPETLRALVIQLGEANGELPGSLDGLREDRGHRFGYQPGVSVFDVQTLHTQYSEAYASCWATAALKVGGRYFQLTEVREGTPPGSMR